jgi:hypothetical protein
MQHVVLYRTGTFYGCTGNIYIYRVGVRERKNNSGRKAMRQK